MPQWDVYPNPAAASRERLPYVVVLQSDLVDALPTRLVAPLARSQVEPPAVPERMTPSFELAGERLLLKVHEAGVLPARVLRSPVASLREQSHRIVDALDAVISGI
ncbi:MAG: CcdB family protein [Rubrivivax sp.]|jgi:toxin CcdB|nr:CcdB family protein [Rubrivivax sp.]